MIQEFVGHLGIGQISPVSVSGVAKDRGNQVQAFLLQPIEQTILYLFVDAAYYKVLEGGRYVTKAALVNAGVREDDFWETCILETALEAGPNRQHGETGQ